MILKAKILLILMVLKSEKGDDHVFIPNQIQMLQKDLGVDQEFDQFLILMRLRESLGDQRQDQKWKVLRDPGADPREAGTKIQRNRVKLSVSGILGIIPHFWSGFPVLRTGLQLSKAT